MEFEFWEYISEGNWKNDLPVLTRAPAGVWANLEPAGGGG